MANRTSSPFVVHRKSGDVEGAGLSTNLVVTPEKISQDQVVLLDQHRRTMKKKGKGWSNVAKPSSQIGEQIGKELRVLYEEVVTQPIPDRFLELLNQLETATISAKGEKKASEEK
jgi:Anti-sigma factor NepR